MGKIIFSTQTSEGKNITHNLGYLKRKLNRRTPQILFASEEEKISIRVGEYDYRCKL